MRISKPFFRWNPGDANLVSILSLVGVLPILLSCGKSENETIKPEIRSITESVYASGIVKAVDQYEAFTSASGPIQEIFVKEGDTVDIETPILAVFSEREKLSRESAELARSFADQQANQSRIRDLELSIELAKSKMKNDSLLYLRQKNLWSKGIGTAVELEQRQLAYQTSKSSYESSLLRYRELKREVEFNSKSASKTLDISKVLESEYILKSKIKGKIYAILKEKGEMVTAQIPLAVLGSTDKFLMELQVDEYDISKVLPGQRVMVSMDSYNGEVFEAKVTQVYPIMDSKSKSFTVEAEFLKNPPRLYPNLTLEANIITDIKEKTLVIPRNYLINDERVITENGDTLLVKVGIKDYQFAEILEGLDEKTTLIKPLK
ncbi:MAG: efflux RND transporter periplasmic adaptor subunit [Algoriphagus sp.]|nr:efflux RND transporter periplasmic adaptor subunit [Algoriphagus sp.]